MKKYCLYTLITLLSLFQLAQGLQAHVDRNNIQLGESFTLIITSSQQNQATPNYAGLSSAFTLLSQVQSKQVTMNNGSMVVKNQWLVRLQPKKIGQLVIPPITVGKQQTQPITITVSKAKPLTNDKQNIFIKAQASTLTPFVQAQVLYTVKLFTTEDIFNNMQSARLLPPKANNAVIRQLGKNTTYRTRINNKNYQVYQIRYAIFPQASGPLIISPPQFRGNMMVTLTNEQLNNVFFGNSQLLDSGLKAIAATGPTITLNVKPQASQFKGSTWLPAKALSIQETWSAHPNQLKVGQSITRTITLRAQGLTAAQLPDLNIGQATNVNTYPDLPTTKTTNTPQGVTSTRVEKIAYVATQAGDIHLPAISLPWWNTQSNQAAIARVPAYTLQVIGGQTTTTAKTAITSPLTTNKSPAKKSVLEKTSFNLLPWLIAALFALLWILTSGLWLIKRFRKQPQMSDADIVSLRASRNAIKQACLKQDAEALKTVLLSWAKKRFGSEHLLSLGQIRERIKDDDLCQAIKRLDFVLYADGKSTWDGKAFWQTFNRYVKTNKRKSNKVRKYDLPSLYPK